MRHPAQHAKGAPSQGAGAFLSMDPNLTAERSAPGQARPLGSGEYAQPGCLQFNVIGYSPGTPELQLIGLTCQSPSLDSGRSRMAARPDPQ